MNNILFQNMIEISDLIQNEKNISLKTALYNTINTMYFNKFDELKYIVTQIQQKDYEDALLDAIYYHFDDIVSYLLLHVEITAEIEKYTFYHGSHASMELITTN
jgi:hypothetical protein